MKESNIGSLRKLELKDAEAMLEWMKDSNINQYFLFDSEKIDYNTVVEFIQQANQQNTIYAEYHWAITDLNDNYMGTISLKNVDKHSAKAEYAISISRKAQGRGYANYATQEVIRYAFCELNLNRVYLNVLSDNIRAIRFYEKQGFLYEGEFRNHIYIRNEYKSLMWFAMLKEDYEKRYRDGCNG